MTVAYKLCYVTSIVIGVWLCLLYTVSSQHPCASDEATAALRALNPEEYDAIQAYHNDFAEQYAAHIQEEGNDPFLYARFRSGEERRRRLRGRRGLLDTSEPLIRIPVVIHVFHTGTNNPTNLADAQIDSMLNVLNDDFNGRNGEILLDLIDPLWDDRIGVAKIEFYKHDTIRTQVDSSFILEPSNTHYYDGTVDSAVAPDTYLNIYIGNTQIGINGYVFRGCLLSSVFEDRDGIVIRNTYVKFVVTFVLFFIAVIKQRQN